MSDYVITVNSTVDLPKEWLSERGVPVVPLKYTIDGKTYEDMSGLSSGEFFGKLREGKMAVTSQVNADEAKAAFEPILKEGKGHCILKNDNAVVMSMDDGSYRGVAWNVADRRSADTSLLSDRKSVV